MNIYIKDGLSSNDEDYSPNVIVVLSLMLFHLSGCVILVSYYLQAKQAAELAFRDNKQSLVSFSFFF